MKLARFLLAGSLLCIAPALLAQRMSGAGIAGGAPLRGATGLGVSRPVSHPGVVGGFHSHRAFRGNRFFSPFWSGAFWWDDGYPRSETQVVVQPPAAPAAQPAPPPVQEVKPANPLLIELQGDRFVRVTGNPPVNASAATPQSAQLPPAILVFRDGHRQEVSSYAIIGPALYASGSYWTTGYWTQKILLADLDLPATVQANQQRGVNFVLPSAPNQVITRP